MSDAINIINSDSPAVAVSVADLVALVTKINQENAARDAARRENAALAEKQKVAEQLAVTKARDAQAAEAMRETEQAELKNRFDRERREIMEAATRAVESLKLRIDAEHEQSRKRLQAAKDAATQAEENTVRLRACEDPVEIAPNQDPTAIIVRKLRIATRVSTGDECTIIIEDGLIAARKEV
jgi:hypothetical protein